MPAPGAWDHIDEATVASLTLAAGLRIAPERLPALTAQVRALGRTDLRIVLVGCEPASVEEEIGLSPVVAAAVDGAVDAVLELVSDRGRLRPMASAGSPG